MIDKFLDGKLSVNILGTSDNQLKNLVDAFIKIGIKQTWLDKYSMFEALRKAENTAHNFVILYNNKIYTTGNPRTEYVLGVNNFVNCANKYNYTIEVSDIDNVFEVQHG